MDENTVSAAPEVVSSPTPAPAAEPNEFVDLASVEDNDFDGEPTNFVPETKEPPVPSTTPVTPSPAPEPKPQVAPATVPNQPPVPPTQPVQPQAPQPQQQPQPLAQPAQPGQQPGLTAEQVQQRRAEIREMIANNYKLSDDDELLLQTEPNKVLPRLVGGLFLDVYEAVFQNLMAQLPQFVSQHVQSTTARQTYNQAFFGKWPELRKQELAPAIKQAHSLYRQVNPNASMEQTIDAVGSHLYSMLGLQNPAAAPQQPAAPKPFVPAVPGGAAPAAPQAPPAATNPFEALAREFEEL